MEEDETFDIVFHPVSNCYVEDVQHIFNEAYRVLKRGGIFLAGLNNEINYIVDEEEKEIVWEMPFNLLNCQIKLGFSSNSKKFAIFPNDFNIYKSFFTNLLSCFI